MLRRLAFLTLIAVVLTLINRSFGIEGIYIDSGSMEPTLPVKASYFLEKITYRFVSPKRGDIVVFPSPIKKGKDLVKRVIAIGGDTIELRNKAVVLNGVVLSEPYVKHTRSTELLEGDNIAPMVVPKGMFFVMGDNRDESGDSRDWTDAVTGEHTYFVPLSQIKGKLIVLY